MQDSIVDRQHDRQLARAGAPVEWLFSVVSDQHGHRRLLEESGSLAIAAFRLALAKCRTSVVATTVPTTLELRGAAREIARRAGLPTLPSIADLVSECEAAGLLVI
jgi:hypothetical protein